MNKKTKTTVRRMFATLMITIWAIVAAVPAFAAPKVKKAEYEGKGRVEVDFNSKVKYKNVKVTVKDNKGATYSTTINEKDDDDLTFTIKNFKTGRTYTYTISGVKKNNESSYGKVTGKVTIQTPTTTPKVKEVDYDKGDREVEFEFTTRVQWKGTKVTITDGSKNYVTRIKEKDSDSIEVKVSKLTIGKKYTYKISGVRIKGANSYKTISGTFIARDN
ncbi:MAG: hypothetical protein J6E41_06375 [Lachnospiraceae bacterium]|nr:hypothetical protein [Lachnospiraceae bacterium]